MLYPRMNDSFRNSDGTMLKHIIISCLFALLLLALFSSNTAAQSASDCLACHEDEELTTERNDREVSLFTNHRILKASPHAKLACVACHVGFDPDEVPHKERITPVKCTNCHKDALLSHKFHEVMLEAENEKGKLSSACKNCHGRHNVLALENPKSPFHETNIVQTCGKCHDKEVEVFKKSIHGNITASEKQIAPTCITCHTVGITTGTKLSKIDLKQAQEHLCLSCHLNNADVKSRMPVSTGFINAYENSIHGQALHSNNANAANCVDCHGSHETTSGSHSSSKVNRVNIPNTCGTCHDKIKEEFDTSIHGTALAHGVEDAPSCIQCHGEHGIISVHSSDSPVYGSNLSEDVCLPCHSSVQMTDKFGIGTRPGQSYLDSYHGLAVQGGSKVAANCASCHGVHDIKPSTDPASTIHPTNRKTTCGKCHPNSSEKFAGGQVHVVVNETESFWQYWVTLIYVLLIIATIGGMAFHNILDFRRKSKLKLTERRRGTHHEVPHNLYLRMSLNERIQHALLAVSFILLVFTGFGLTYPHAWWVEYIRQFGGDWAFEARGILHRISGAVMLVVSLFHVYYIFFVPRGRQFIKDMLPVWKDIKDVFHAFKWYLGRTTERPRFDRFSYMEKAEYWALIWGTFVMGATGIMLWFHEYFGAMTSKEFLDIMTIVHFYEAWLATLAIIVWHFYFIIFNPDVYPLNVAFLRGTITEHEMLEEHPIELERIKAKAGDITIDTTPEIEPPNGNAVEPSKEDPS
jgi:cytochrome b subunit of formate dehydrogenase